MNAALEFAEGPLFRFAFLVMVLGLLRLVVVSVAEIVEMRRRTRDKSSKIGGLLAASVAWMRPPRWIAKPRGYYTVTSIVFHVGLILTPLFFLPHIELWARATGLSWPGMPGKWADALTALTIATAVLLVVFRLSDRGSRALSKPQDWLLTPLCAVVFLAGFLATHPTHSPFAYTTTRLVHVLAGDLLLVLMPFTKLAHVVLLPFTQVIADLSWKLVPGVGEKVRAAVGREDWPI